MGYSDHLAQYVCMKVNKVQEGPKMMYKRQFTNTNMDHFRHVMYEEKWEEIIKANEPNISFMLFMNIFMHYFNVAFPVNKIKVQVNYTVRRRITKGLIVSRNKLCILQKIKRRQCLSAECLEYIHNYQRIFRKVVNEAKRKESDRYVLTAKNKSKALWKLINKESGKIQQNHNITIKKGYNLITNPQIIADCYNKFFIDTVEDLLLQRNKNVYKFKSKFQIQRCSETMFVAPVTTTELERVIASLKKNASAGYDEIPWL